MNLGLKTVKKTNLAFTLVDVMVGMGVLGVVLLSLFAAFSFGFGVVKVTREDLQATQLIEEKMEVIRLYKWADFTNSGYVSTNFTASFASNGPAFYRGTVEIARPVFDANDGSAYSNELRKVTITLSWTNNNIERKRAATTFVSHYGLQNYVLK
jgi:type II secretory pathway pseudopilin PulG